MRILTIKTSSLIAAGMFEGLSRAVAGLSFKGIGSPSITLNTV
jgi:hypothetical protein